MAKKSKKSKPKPLKEFTIRYELIGTYECTIQAKSEEEAVAKWEIGDFRDAVELDVSDMTIKKVIEEC